ncbi:double-stranded DNA 3'-5' exodeoxyribonuclease [Aureococcus anophagefferens]|nr:double-stranded DNA 3'-5' exodeoxyribonuclease [Aureococcus anophagefferens]
MEGVDDERSAVSSDLGDAPATRAAARAEARRARDARRESEKSERAARVDLEALEHRSRQRERSLELELESTKKDLDAALARVARSRDDVEAGLRTAAKLADCEIAKKRLEARLSFLEEQHGKSLDAVRDASAIEGDALRRIAAAERVAEVAQAEAAHQRAVAAAEAKRADGADYRAALSDEAVREKGSLRGRAEGARGERRRLPARLEDRSAELAAATEKQITIIRSERETERAAASARADAAEAESRRVADMAEAAAERRVLAYELAASSTRLQGAERDAAAFKIENGALKEQVDVASREVAALEERLASSRRERDATVDGLEHKVRAYETLELELDSAVLRCADGTQGVDANGNVLASPELRDAALAAGLSRPERRVRHAVLLAQKLLRTEAELRESLQGEDGARRGRRR